MKNSNSGRREFLKKSMLIPVLLGLTPSEAIALMSKSDDGASLPWPKPQGPLQRIKETQFPSLDFNGDDIHRPHKILWDVQGFIRSKGGIPPVTEFANVVIVGGGMAGMISAYFLKEFSPVVLEGAPQFGGNSRGELWQDSPFSIGAATISTPEDGSFIDHFLKDLGFNKSDFRSGPVEERTVAIGPTAHRGFWKGESDPSRAGEFKAMLAKLKEIYQNSYPHLPMYQNENVSREQFNELDSVSFQDWLKREFPGLHPHLDEYFALYCWSAFGAEINEISAAHALNFLASDVQGTLALPGGNSAIGQKLFQRLERELPQGNLRNGHFVFDVRHHEDGVDVSYEDSEGNVRTIRAKTCIFAAQKRVAKHVMTQLSKEQTDAMEQVRYRTYLVANVLLKNKVRDQGHAIYLMKGVRPESANREGDLRMASDVVFADWASQGKNSNSILTFYVPRARSGSEHFLMSPSAHDKYRKRLLDAIPEWMKSLGLSMEDIEGIRMTRWGHAMPLASTGLIASGKLEMAHAPLGGKIFFAHQDNWASPCFESSFESARQSALKIADVLRA